MKKWKFEIPLYGGILVITQSKDFKKIEQKFDLEDTTDYGAFVFQVKTKRKDEMHYMMCFLKDKNNLTPGIIAHEATHVVNHIYSQLGIEHDLYNDEPQAYLTEWIVNRCHDVLEMKK